MKKLLGIIVLVLFFSSAALASEPAKKILPQFSIAWSEYPSWSTFGVAHVYGFIDGQPGKYGPIEKKWGVDIVLKEADYDPCIQMYGSGTCDAVCVTNMDILAPALGRPSVAIMPTSTSDGADACLVTPSVKTAADLKGKKVYGLAKSVSEYAFYRNIKLLGLRESDFKFSGMDPAAAAVAMQQKQKGFEAIMVWNPFVFSTLEIRKDVRVLFDSTTIPGEIVDMVVVAKASLEKPGGEAFAYALLDTYYSICERMRDQKTRDDTLVALGEKFSDLKLEAMKKVCQQTKFYDTPTSGINVYTGKAFSGIMVQVVDFCLRRDMFPKKPTIGYGSATELPNVDLCFDESYMKTFLKKEKVRFQSR